jgi:catechol 2,3-dioxygenase-like lactoylglutathione lyase family enzyme
MKITGTDFVTLASSDIDRSVEFYGTVLGLPESARYGQMPGVEFETGNLTLALLESKAFGIEFQAHNHPVALHVDDVAEARAELEAKGVGFGADTMDTGVCHMAHFRDPDGNVLMLHHRYAPRT